MTQADSFAELEEMIKDAMRVWIESALEDGQPVPEPRSTGAFSGKFVVRVPRSMHRQLVTAAARDGVSLNTYVNVALAQMVGMAGRGQEHEPSNEFELASA
jgi:antitoxin HicB